MSRREEFIAKTKEGLDKLNAEIDELETKAQAAAEEARLKLEEQTNHLREVSQPVVDKLEELKSAGEDQWDRLIAEGEKLYKASIHSYHYFKSQLK
jgi:DNA-binding transcriptional regulator GbsR (MarR family)